MRFLARIAAPFFVAALLVSAAQAGSSNGPARPFPGLTNVTLGAGGSGTEAAWSTLGTETPSVGYGQIAIRVAATTFGDSTVMDSVLLTIYPFVDVAVDSSGYTPLPSTDLKFDLDGFLCTTYDSTALCGPGNVTPITGAASTISKWPNYLPSRIVSAKLNKKVAGVDIPGASSVKFGFGATDKQSRYVRWFIIQLSGPFGESLRGARRMSLELLNRQPRISFVTSAWLLPSAD